MKISISLLFTVISAIVYSQGNQEELKNKLEPELSVSLNSNGFNPIPAFSLDKPAIIASVNLTKGRFSYDPTFAYSLEMKPWFIDNWLHYKIITRPKFELRTGVNFSSFVSGLEVNGDEIMKAERYFSFAMAGTYRFSNGTSLTLDYWSDNGQEKGSISGHFINMVLDRSDINLGGKVMLSASIMLFSILYDGNNDGLFVSPTVSFSIRDIPVALFFQATQAIQSNISPWPGFKWNVGISYDI